jgi:hypothetical protein
MTQKNADQERKEGGVSERCKCGNCKCGKRQVGDPSYTAQDSVARLEDGLAKVVADRINRGWERERRIMS